MVHDKFAIGPYRVNGLAFPEAGTAVYTRTCLGRKEVRVSASQHDEWERY